jgi:lipoprotein-anchoring transpeptidase ErfK/SrfK
MLRFKLPRVLILLLLGILLVGTFKLVRTFHPGPAEEPLRLLYLKQLVLAFANRYQGRSAIVVSKRDHLLYYCENGRIVENDYWNGFVYSFPVKVSLASHWYRTPEGLMYIDSKNERSRYTLFLHLSVPGAYGIHGAATRLASYLNKMEYLDHDFSFVTRKDDTRGCVAVENRVIKYLFAKVGVNTPVWIMP